MRDDEPFEELPQSLSEELKAIDRAIPMITARVDREVASMARAHFAGRRRATQAWRRPARAAVAATVLVAVVVLQWPLPAPDRDQVYADVDHSGHIDIADVLALARAQAPGERSQATLDAFAYRIVSLEPDEDAS